LYSSKLCYFPKNKVGVIVDYDNRDMEMPRRIIEIGLLPSTHFKILYQAPFNGPIYVEYGEERAKVALREDEAKYIIVEFFTNGD